MKEEIIKCVVDNSLLDNISNIATLLISIVNLIFVIWVYRTDKKERNSEKIKNHKYEWYKMIDVQTRVKKLNDLSEKVKSLSTKLLESDEDSTDKRTMLMSEYIETLNDIFYSEKASFNYLLKSIDKDSNIELTQLYNKYQEEYMNILIVSKAKENIDYSSLQEIESKISDLYYKIGLNLIK